MTLEEAILNKLRHLPRAKQEEVLRFADGLQHQGTTTGVVANGRSVGCICGIAINRKHGVRDYSGQRSRWEIRFHKKDDMTSQVS